MRITYLIVTLSLIFSLSHNSFSQGCSDAGVCTMDFNDHSDAVKRNQLSASIIYGKADHSINATTLSLEYQHIHPVLGLLSIKVSGSSLSGSSLNNSGLSDIFLSGSSKVAQNISVLYGVKIPLNDGNSQKENKTLPLDLQTSLGTFDVYAGMKIDVDRFAFTLAYQTPLSNSSNTFLPSLYTSSSEFASYTPTKNFKRKADLVGRIDYVGNVSETFDFMLSMIPIYHVADDEAENDLGAFVIGGSSGLTLNGSVTGNLILNSESQISSTFAMPFITRDVRPDGLTRAFVVQIKYSYLF